MLLCIVNVVAKAEGGNRESRLSDDLIFTVVPRLVNVVASDEVEIEKVFDGTVVYVGTIEQGIHYFLQPIGNQNVDIMFWLEITILILLSRVALLF